jgi:hypothetical protein
MPPRTTTNLCGNFYYKRGEPLKKLRLPEKVENANICIVNIS